MKIKELIPWRIRHLVDNYLENTIRSRYPHYYKLIKFGKTNINTPDYWDKEWQSDSVQRSYDELFSLILERIEMNAQVIDIGAGIGRLSKLIKLERDAEVTCLDFSSWACSQLAEQGFQTVVSKLPEIPLPDNSFDIAVATEVFEHLDNPEKTLQQMARIVRSGGLVICSVPNDIFHPHEELEHQQSYTIDKIETMLAKLGGKVTVKTGKFTPESKYEFILGIVEIA